MKIMQIIPTFKLAGAETMCENLCIALKDAGEVVIAVSLYSDQTAITKRLEEKGIHIEFLGKQPGFDPMIFIKLVKLLKKEQPDIVHTHIVAAKYALPAAVIAGVKRKVHTIHNMAQKEQGSIGKKINAFMYKYCGVIPVALSQEVRKSIQEVYNIPEAEIPVIYNGIDLANSLMIKDKVEFLGLKSNVYPYLNKADVFCLPSKYEGIPMSLIEAMGTGLPIIASNVGGIPDMLTDKKDALLVIPEEDEIAEAFEMLYSDDDLKKKLGVAAKERSQSFSANVMAIKYINVYKM